MAFNQIAGQTYPAQGKADTAVTTKATRMLAWVTLVLGLLTILSTTYIGVCGYSPVLFGDEWTMPMDTVLLGGHYPLSKLWEQHNEHRIPFQKALELLGMYWFHADQRFLLILNWLVEASLCAAGAFFLKRFGEMSSAEWLTAVGLVCFAAFNPAPMEMFVWGIGPSFLFSFVAVFVSLCALTMFSVRANDTGHRWRWFVMVLVAAALAETNLASGVLVWVILPLSALLLGLRLRVAASLAAIGICGIAIYLIGYHTPSNAANPLESARNVGAVLTFMVTHLGETWRNVFPQAGTLLAVAGLLEMVLLPAVAFFPWKKDRAPLVVFAWSLSALMVLTSLVMALGRQNESVEQAHAGRYQASAVLFWLGIALVLLASTRAIGKFRATGLLVLQALFCAVMVKNLLAFPNLVRQWTHESYIKNMAGLSVELGVSDLPMIRHIYPTPHDVIPLYRAMTSQGLVKPPFSEYKLIGRPFGEVFTVRGSGCTGNVQTIAVIANRSLEKDIVADGWFKPGQGQPNARRVIATTDEGWIVGFGVADNYEWHLAGTVPKLASKLSVYAVLPDGNSVCFPPAEKSLP